MGSAGRRVTLTSTEVESTHSLVGRRAVFRTNGHLMNDAAEGRGGFSEPPRPCNNIAGIAEHCERKQAKAGGGTKMVSSPQAQAAPSMCASLPEYVTIIHHRHLQGPSLLKTGLTEMVNPV